MLVMDQIQSPTRVLLLAGRRTAPTPGRGGIEIKRYRLARARLDRQGVAQRSTRVSAAASRSASLFIP
jgi:hypothetical protein